MNIYLDKFNHNNPDLKVEDVVANIKIGKTKGIINVYFESKSKYLYVNADTYTYLPGVRGELIDIQPIITGCEEGDGWYFSHPDYFYVSLIVDTPNEKSYSSIVTALKHQYIISLVPDELILDHKTLKETKLIINEHP